MKRLTLGDVCKKASSNIAQKDLQDKMGVYPIYGASGLIKQVDFYQQGKEYIAVVKDGAGIGRTMLLPAYSSVIGTMQYLLPKEGIPIDIKYLFYAVEHMNLAKYFSGATIPHIYFKDYQKEPINIPDIDTQKRISRIFDKIDALISSRKEQRTKLDQIVKSRFIEMFVETDVVSEWPYHTIADVSDDMRTGPFGSALHHDEFVDSGVFVLGIDNAVENKFSYSRMRYITEEKYQQLKKYTVHLGDVIITIMGTVGRSAVIPVDMPKAINTKHLACITPKAETIDAQFLSCAFQVHPDIRMQLQKQCKGAIMDGLNLTIIKGLSFHIPPISLQKQFVEFYEQTDKSKYRQEKYIGFFQCLEKSIRQEWL